MSNLPHPAALTRSRRYTALVMMALAAMLMLAWSLLAQAGGDTQARVGVRNAAGFVAVDTMPGDGAPPESTHHPVERKKPRQLELAAASQAGASDCASASSAGIAPIAGIDAPAVDVPSAGGAANAAQLPRASADAGQLRLHPGQAPPSA